MSKRVDCPDCGESVTPQTLARHMASLRCGCQTRAREARASGLLPCGDFWRALQKAGIAIEQIQTQHVPGFRGKREDARSPYWGPAWAVRAAQLARMLDADTAHTLRVVGASAELREALSTLSEAALTDATSLPRAVVVTQLRAALA